MRTLRCLDNVAGVRSSVSRKAMKDNASTGHNNPQMGSPHRRVNDLVEDRLFPGHPGDGVGDGEQTAGCPEGVKSLGTVGDGHLRVIATSEPD